MAGCMLDCRKYLKGLNGQDWLWSVYLNVCLISDYSESQEYSKGKRC